MIYVTKLQMFRSGLIIPMFIFLSNTFRPCPLAWAYLGYGALIRELYRSWDTPTHFGNYFLQIDQRQRWTSQKKLSSNHGCSQKHFLRYTPITESKRAIMYHFYRAMHVVLARYCYRMSSVRPSVCLSVCPSVTLTYAEHIGWTSSKLVTRIISLGSSLLGATTSPI